MTGYGRGEVERKGVRVTAELRSFNNRFLELTPKLPRFLAPLEGDIKRVIHKQVSRGRVLVNISWENAEGLAETISLDEEVADRYYGLLQAVKERYKLPGDIDLSVFTALPDLLKRDIAEGAFRFQSATFPLSAGRAASPRDAHLEKRQEGWGEICWRSRCR